MMQRIAHAARSDVRAKKREILLQCGKTDEADNDEETFYDLDILSNLGCEGKFSNNCARDLRNHVIRSRTAEPLHVKMPLKDATSVRHMHVDQCIFLPHAWFASMYNDYPESFKERIAPDHDTLERFWADMRRSPQHPQLARHPVLARPQYAKWAIPFSLHGDGVPVTGVGKSWGQTMNFYSWTSLCAKGTTMDMNFYIWAVWKRMIADVNCFKTMNKFWAILTWSLHWLHRGLWPDVDWDGKRRRCEYVAC
jgi:hypothetical protein